MDNDFSYMKEGEYYKIQKHTFPRFHATFDYRKPLPTLIKIEFDDDCEAIDMSAAFSALDDYMKSIRKELR